MTATEYLESLARKYQVTEDPALLQELIRCLHPILLSFFTAQVSRPEDAQDLTQNTLFSIYKHIGTFRSDARFKTWAFSIAANELKNRWRYQGAQKRKGQEISLESPPVDEESTSMHQEIPDSLEDPLTQLLAAEQRSLLEQSLLDLPPRPRQCMALRLQDLSNDEIAYYLKIEPSTVKTHLRTAYARLRPLFKPPSSSQRPSEPPP